MDSNMSFLPFQFSRDSSLNQPSSIHNLPLNKTPTYFNIFLGLLCPHTTLIAPFFEVGGQNWILLFKEGPLRSCP